MVQKVLGKDSPSEDSIQYPELVNQLDRPAHRIARQHSSSSSQPDLRASVRNRFPKRKHSEGIFIIRINETDENAREP